MEQFYCFYIKCVYLFHLCNLERVNSISREVLSVSLFNAYPPIFLSSVLQTMAHLTLRVT